MNLYNTNPYHSLPNPSVPAALNWANMDLIALLEQLGTTELEIYNESAAETEAKSLEKHKCIGIF